MLLDSTPNYLEGRDECMDPAPHKVCRALPKHCHLSHPCDHKPEQHKVGREWFTHPVFKRIRKTKVCRCDSSP